jgi:hypothetical protein
MNREAYMKDVQDASAWANAQVPTTAVAETAAADSTAMTASQTPVTTTAISNSTVATPARTSAASGNQATCHNAVLAVATMGAGLLVAAITAGRAV